MKALKFVLIGLVVLIVVIIIGVSVFLSTFDLNKYLGPIKEQASSALGRDVTIDQAKLDLNILKGVRLALKGIVVADDPAFSKEAFLTLDRFDAAIDVMALLTKREIVITSIDLVQWKVNVIRNAQGLMNAQTIGPKPAAPVATLPDTSSTTKTTPTAAPALPVLTVHTIHIDGGTLNFKDENAAMPIDLTVKDIAIEITNFSLTEEAVLKLKAAVLSQTPNIHVQTKFKLNMATQAVTVNDFKLDTSLATYDLNAFKQAMPALAQMPLPKSVSGQVTVHMAQLNASAAGLEGLNASVKLTDGAVDLNEIPTPITAITADINADLNQIDVTSFNAKIGDGSVKAQVKLNDYMKIPSYTVSFDASGLQAGQLVDFTKQPVSVKATINSKGELSGAGFVLPEAYGQLKGHIEANVGEGIVEKLNIATSVLGKLGQIPVIGAALTEVINGSLREVLGGDTTAINKGSLVVNLAEGQATIDTLNLDTKPLIVDGKGTLNLTDLSTEIPLQVIFAADISQKMIKGVEQLQGLANEQGQIMIPGKISGTVPNVGYSPDLTYITKKVATNEAANALGQQLDKALEKNPEVRNLLNSVFGGNKSTSQDTTNQVNEGNATEPTENTESQGSDGKKMINNLFNSILK